MTRPRSADDFGAIRARVEELRRQRVQLSADEGAPTAPEPALDPRRSGPVSAASRPGIPGWRVSRKKRPLSVR